MDHLPLFPLGSVLVSPPGHGGEILIGTTERGGVVVDGSLVARRQLAGIPVADGRGDACTMASPEVSAFEGNAFACEIPEPVRAPLGAGGSKAGARGKAGAKPASAARPEAAVVFAPPSTRYDAIASLDAVGRDGAVTQVLAAREPSGTLHVRVQEAGAPRAFEATLEGVGAQLALVDLDLDGTPEIVTTADSLEDHLVVSSVSRVGITERLRFPAKEGVRAVGVCPPEERGVPALVAVVGSEVWVVR